MTKTLSQESWMNFLIEKDFPVEDTLIASDWMEEQDQPFVAEFLHWVLARKAIQPFKPFTFYNEAWWWDYSRSPGGATPIDPNLLPTRLWSLVPGTQSYYKNLFYGDTPEERVRKAWLGLLEGWIRMRTAGEPPIRPDELK